MDGDGFRTRRAEPGRTCDHPDCTEDGLHRAPQARERLDAFFWFCKPHAREYNAAWDYCAGMSEADLDRMVRDAATWDRPTWPLGLRIGAARARADVRDGTGFFDEEGAFRSDDAGAEFRRRARRRPDEGPEAQAMRVLALKPPLSLTALKRRYKELAKALHPDLGGESRSEAERRDAEERLKEINRAYAVLRADLAAAPRASTAEDA
ncbi:MAG: J domain-containing protein [Alphaproteobacteria bacterium]|nr:J domain-containing protein [Alphaproteobacteria bacterium]